jgi:hypothetical protein
VLIASALMVAEGHGWFLRRYDHNRAVQFLNFMGELPMLTITPFDSEVLGQTTRLAKKFANQPLTLADAHGLVIIKERRISTCWSTDRHSGLTGARLVIASLRGVMMFR